MWPLSDNDVVYTIVTEWRSIFICENHETDIFLVNFRRNLLKPMIRLGLDVKMHASDL